MMRWVSETLEPEVEQRIRMPREGAVQPGDFLGEALPLGRHGMYSS